jgi:NADPH:quinone reductase-like Zn-dependent oxidoreductase
LKAVRYHEHGDADVLRYEDVDVPEPGPGEVRVRVEACGVNHFDIDLRSGISRWPLPLPHQLGVEFAGTVDAVGEGVEHLKVGDGVWPQHEVHCGVCRFCERGQPNICLDAKMMSVQYLGGYAEYVIAPARATHLLPAGVTAEMAAAGQVIFTTAWHMIVTRGKLQPGETVVVQAAGSGIGSAAIQIAALNGARVIATAGADHKLERARQIGATETINYNERSIREAVMEITDGEGADLFIEHVGGDLFMDSVLSLRKDGRLVTCGGHGGETPKIDIVEMFRNEYQVLGSRVGTPHEMKLTMQLMGEGKLKPDVHAAIPLRDAAEAHRILEQRKQTGKVVLVP